MKVGPFLGRVVPRHGDEPLVTFREATAKILAFRRFEGTRFSSIEAPSGVDQLQRVVV